MVRKAVPQVLTLQGLVLIEISIRAGSCSLQDWAAWLCRRVKIAGFS